MLFENTRLVLTGLILCLLTACATAPPKENMIKTSCPDTPTWSYEELPDTETTLWVIGEAVHVSSIKHAQRDAYRNVLNEVVHYAGTADLRTEITSPEPMSAEEATRHKNSLAKNLMAWGVSLIKIRETCVEEWRINGEQRFRVTLLTEIDKQVLMAAVEELRQLDK